MTDEAKELADWLHTVTAYWPQLPGWTLYKSSQVSAAWRTHGEHVPTRAIYASDKQRKRGGARALIVLEAHRGSLDVYVGVTISKTDPVGLIRAADSGDDLGFLYDWVGFLEEYDGEPLSSLYGAAESDCGFIKEIRKALDALDANHLVLRLRAIYRQSD